MRLYSYTIRIMTTVEGGGLIPEEMEALQGALQDAEDVIDDQLPEGYYCKIDDAPEGVDMQAVERLERYARGE